MVPDLRLLPTNGSLVFPPFPAAKFRHDIHAAIYRCIARNSVGAIVSRDIVVRAGKLVKSDYICWYAKKASAPDDPEEGWKEGGILVKLTVF